MFLELCHDAPYVSIPDLSNQLSNACRPSDENFAILKQIIVAQKSLIWMNPTSTTGKGWGGYNHRPGGVVPFFNYIYLFFL